LSCHNLLLNRGKIKITIEMNTWNLSSSVTNGNKISRESIKLVAVGDIMFGEHPLCLGHGVSSVIDENGSGFIFEKIAPALRDADVIFCNLENMLLDVVGETNRFEDKYLRGSKECVEALKCVGFNIVNLANNHALQHKTTGFYGTIDLLDRHDIKHIGVRGHNYAEFDFGSIKLGFLGYCSDQQYETEIDYVEPLNLSRISQDIGSLKKSGINFIVISLHWGTEFVQKPSLKQIETGRKIIEMGANIILGHHSHVIQGIEKYKGGLIVYSLGNFVSDMQWDKNLKRTMILSCEISKRDGLKFTIIPISINKNFQPEIDNGVTGAGIIKVVETLSKDLDTLNMERPLYSDCDYISYVKKQKNINRLEMYRHFISHLHKYKIKTAYEILWFFFLKKMRRLPWTGKRFLAR